MIKSICTVEVPLACSEAWRRYTDVGFIFKVDKNIKKTVLISGPKELGLGRRTELHYEFRGRPFIIIQDITAFEPGRRLFATGENPTFYSESDIVFEPVGESSTKITATQAIRYKGWRALLTWMAIRGIDRLFQRYFETFAKELTGLPGGPFHVQTRTTWRP